MKYLLHALILFILCLNTYAEQKAGEIILLPIFPMDEAQVQKLHKTFEEPTEEIKNIKSYILSYAKSHTKHQASPLKKIHYEGKLNTDPKRQKSVKALHDMVILSHLTYAAIIDAPDNSTFIPQIKNIILAWSSTYIPTGNPINENKLEALFCSYYIFKNKFSTDQQSKVDSFIRKLAKKERERKVSKTNWFTKKIKLLLYAGLILNDKNQVNRCVNEYKEYIAHSLRANGSSIEIEKRDAMSYHVAGLKPLLQIAIILRNSKQSENLYEFTSKNGSSLKKSSQYVLPYAKKEKVYEQWRNTKVELDKKRAAAGIEKYQPGYKWKPEKGMDFYIMASCFDKQFDAIVSKYKNSEVNQSSLILDIIVRSL